MPSARSSALGFVEVPFLSGTALVADHMAKAANIEILGFETTGNPSLLIRIAGDASSIRTAVEAAEAYAKTLGTEAIVRSIPAPDSGMEPLINFANAQNPLYGGRDQFLPADYPQPTEQTMSTPQQALGIIETQGLTAILEATDVMLKAANVTLVGKEKIGAAYVTVIVRGDVAAVKAAVDAGAKAVDGLGKLVAAHVIARPHADLLALLPK
jgi:carbon dioxide concentrating mechanism protein CcmO